MKQGRNILRLMAEAADTPQELVPGTPLIEITGTQRVLVENQRGVTLYEQDLIRVKLQGGYAVVRGSCLTITRMEKRQLVITGTIHGVELERGGRC